MISVSINGCQKSVQKNTIGEMKKSLMQQLQVQNINQIGFVAGNQFIDDYADISQYHGPYKFITAKYVEELELGEQVFMNQYQDQCSKFEKLQNDYQKLQEKLQENKSVDEISKEIGKQYRSQKQYDQDEFEPQCLEEYQIIIDRLNQELQLKQDNEEELKKDLNSVKIKYGLLRIEIQKQQQNIEIDQSETDRTNSNLQATIDNLNEQIAQLKQDKKNLEAKYRKDMIQTQSIIQRNTAPDKLQILEKQYDNLREKNKQLNAEIQKLQEELQSEKLKAPEALAESVLITQSTKNIQDEIFSLKLKQSQMDALSDKFKELQTENGNKDLKYDQLKRESTIYSAQIPILKKEIEKLRAKIKELEPQKQKQQ